MKIIEGHLENMYYKYLIAVKIIPSFFFTVSLAIQLYGMSISKY